MRARLFPTHAERWWAPFGLMLGPSVVIAVIGLSANSPALVIGAMLIAPLMTPVLALATALALTLGRHAGRAALTVLGATVRSSAGMARGSTASAVAANTHA